MKNKIIYNIIFKLIISSIIIATCVIAFYLILKPSKCKYIDCLIISSLESYSLTEVYQNEKDIIRAIYKNQDNILKVGITYQPEKSVADKDINSQIIKTKSFYENTPSPYPGDISDEIICSDEYKPVFSEFESGIIQIHTIEGYLNERLAFGGCNDDPTYKNLLVLFYCRSQQKIYQLEFIVDKSDTSEFKNIYDSLSNLKCI